MPGHNGYGATGSSGRLPKATVHLNVPTLPRGLIKFAAQVKSLSVQLRLPVLNIIERARMDGYLECDDEQAFAIADLADKLKPNL